MAEHASLRAATLALVVLVAACSGPPATSPSESPSGDASPSGTSASPGSSPSASPQRALATLAPDETWRPVLELISGPLGAREGSFDVRTRYRIRYDCVGEGTIAVRVANRIRVRRDCSDEQMSEPEAVRTGGAARLRARVIPEGEVEWVVHFEVPR